jgi:hypothetical protein
MAVVIKCDCSSDYQDQKLGAGRRLANTLRGGGARCTVCSKEHNKGGAKFKK